MSLVQDSALKTVMICDDEQDVLRAYRIALNSRFNVLTANSGNQCLKSYSEATDAKKKVDAVVMDYRLGDMMGDEVAYRLKDIASTNVLLLTAFEIEPNRIKELKEQKIISSFMKKPVSLAALIAAINELVGSPTS
jgi:response regulator RpfG family c-di-GMP phosphodiesterase